MNAYELADWLEQVEHELQGKSQFKLSRASDMLRQQAEQINNLQQWEKRQLDVIESQADRIAELEKELNHMRSFFGCDPAYYGMTNAEPVAWIRSGDDQLSLVKGKNDGYMIWKPLYTTPQIKELSDEEVYALSVEAELEQDVGYGGDLDMFAFAKAILKKASEK